MTTEHVPRPSQRTRKAGPARPAPEIPKEARSHFSKAYALQHMGKSAHDSEQAIAEYQKAIELAPWWAAAYYHLGTAYETAGQYDLAIRNLKFYLDSSPQHSGSREALDHIQHSEKELKKGENRRVQVGG